VQGALSRARDILLSSRLPNKDLKRADSIGVQAALGRLLAQVLVVESACLGLARLSADRRCALGGLLYHAIGIKQVAVDICTRSVSELAELIGATAYRQTDVMERLWRDVQAIRFHPPTRLISQEILGKWWLGAPFSFDLF
jgi:alkylation response protein AidB-like acyl-CoA dehydrogenase